MSYSSQTSPDSSNNNSSSSLASHYATAALGVGLLVLGVVMILWSMLPAGTAVNTPESVDGQAVRNTSSVGFVLLGTGVAMLLLSLFLGAQNKYRTQRHENSNDNTHPEQGQEGERQLDNAEQYTVPTYEEVVGSDQYPIRQFSPRQNSTTRLPAYEELVARTQDESEGSDPTRTQLTGQTRTLPAQLPQKNGRTRLNMISLPLRTKSTSSEPQIVVSSIEPLTPPPQYEENPPQLSLPAQ
ncbi:transmembrane protein 51a [Trichomycterus rosablanca]|uniref:transmembrane protein 51a n=1 Tax=Trichomycterus rosablanca TaxID=2290929 RepID=UPI002F34F71A